MPILLRSNKMKNNEKLCLQTFILVQHNISERPINNVIYNEPPTLEQWSCWPD